MTCRLSSLLLLALVSISACDAPAIQPSVVDVLRPDGEGEPVAVQPAVAAGPRPAEVAAPQRAPNAAEDGEWNGDEIRWLDYDTGLARARAEGKPVCLVMHADWCPHCHTYARVFGDPRVVAQSRRMVMVRVNVDHAREIATRYAVDGTYVPRTYFLKPDGTVMERIDARRPQFRYFFDENDPSSILGGMIAALEG